MQQIFMQMFHRSPDDISMGGYFYHSEYEKIFDHEETSITPEEYYKFYLKLFQEYLTQCRTEMELDALSDAEFSNEAVRDIVRQISAGGQPFLEICETFRAGFAPHVLKLNPSVPCLVSSNDELAMKAFKASLEATSSEYSISVTSFDINDIPIKDRSLQWITSSGGLSGFKNVLPYPDKTDLFCFSAGKENAIRELYRILAPGGCLVVMEKNRECDYDPAELYADFCAHGPFFDIYTFEEICAVCNQLREESWREKFEAAGFIVEKEEKFYHLCNSKAVMGFFYHFTKQHGIHHFQTKNLKEEWDRLSRISVPAPAGFELFDTKTFLVLRKPSL